MISWVKTSWTWRGTTARFSCTLVRHGSYLVTWGRMRSLHMMFEKIASDNCAIADEEEITFPPTYRFERDTREKYAYTKAKATGVRSPAVEVDSATQSKTSKMSETLLINFTYPSSRTRLVEREARPDQGLAYSTNRTSSLFFFLLNVGVMTLAAVPWQEQCRNREVGYFGFCCSLNAAR